MTFKTEQEDPDVYQSTFENDASTKAYEQEYFSRYSEVTRINADIFDHTDAGTSKTYSMRLNSTGNEIYGLAKSLEVKPGDVVEAEVWAKYLDPSTTGTPGSSFAQLIEDLSNNASTVVVDGATAGTNPIAPLAGLMDHSNDNSSGPKAYLNIVVVDREGNVEDLSYVPVTSVAREDGTDVTHQYLKTASITVKEPGLAYIYLSNETGTRVEVFFDDFKVTHTNSQIVQKDDYYPFGLSFNSYQRPSSTSQNFKFQGQEHISDLGLNWYSFKWRNHQPDLGRFFNIDPLAADYVHNSPYAFAENKVLTFIELEGLEGVHSSVLIKAALKDNVVNHATKANNSARNIVSVKGGVQGAGIGGKFKLGKVFSVNATGKALSVEGSGNTNGEASLSSSVVSTDFEFKMGNSVDLSYSQDDIKTEFNLSENGLDGDIQLRDRKGKLKVGNYSISTDGHESSNEFSLGATMGNLSGEVSANLDAMVETINESVETTLSYFENIIKAILHPEERDQ